MIDVQHLHKTYRVPVREPGFANAVRSLWDRKFRDVHAVRDVSFRIEPGERVGFLGPNGAGKTTTLKMLTGLLHPSSGTVRVLDMVPQDRPRALLSRIAMVMGQKNGLLWDLPAPETFELHRALFDIPDATFQASRDELVELLQLADFLDRPVRNLSLGQRMRCELAAALLHRPKVLFLDEPTIGLDVEVQVIVRAFIAEYNRRHNATVVLTSHNMDDVAAICDRVLLIDEGSLRFDGPLPELARRFGHGRRLTVRGPGLDLSEMGFERATQRDTWQRTDEPAAVNQALAAVLARWPDADLTVEDPPLEDVLRKAFQAKDGA